MWLDRAAVRSRVRLPVAAVRWFLSCSVVRLHIIIACWATNDGWHWQVVEGKLWRRVANTLHIPPSATAASFQLRKLYQQFVMSVFDTGGHVDAAAGTTTAAATPPTKVDLERERHVELLRRQISAARKRKKLAQPKHSNPPKPAKTWPSWEVAALPDNDSAGKTYPGGVPVAPYRHSADSSTSKHSSGAGPASVVRNTKTTATSERNRAVRASCVVNGCQWVIAGCR